MNISFLNEKGNKYLVYVLLGILVLVVLFPTDSVSNTQKDMTSQESMPEGELESQLKRVLSAMEGVGEVEVMITTQNKQGSLFGDESNSPIVCGVVVVAEGAEIPTVNARILKAVEALFAVDAHKISIVKMRSQEGDR